MLPILSPIAGSDFNELIASSEILAKMVGNWSLFGLFLIMVVFNILGEEFIFRGILLPKMKGVFGKYDWVVNGLLMGAYHWHQPWTIPGAILHHHLFLIPSKRFKSTYISMVTNGSQFILSLPIILLQVLGLGP